MALENALLKDGDLVQLVGKKHKYYFIKLKAGQILQTHKGIIPHDDMIGKPWGARIKSHLGNPFYVFQPSIADMLTDIPRNTQIMYPKDIGYILMRMGIEYGQRVIEAGTGSGAFTSALALRVGDDGKVYSYEQRLDSQSQAKKNLNRFGLLDRVDLKLRDISEGFDEEGVDALFLDVKTPYDYISQVRKALKIGGYFGSILPTANQVIRLIETLKRYDFAFIEVVETSLRYYRAEPERFRPVDRMVAHTGFLLFARPVDRDSLFNSNNDENVDDISKD
jgi:tRNA (adenine57-N1/adenine58-N1)-methyltransferase catalytic subunit